MKTRISGIIFLTYFCGTISEMMKWLHRSLLLITGVLFALAILEIHGEDSQNTFFDQDDTYIQSNNQNAELSYHLEQQNNFTKELQEFTSILFELFSPTLKVYPDISPQKKFTCLTPKIFLRNSVWRI